MTLKEKLIFLAVWSLFIFLCGGLLTYTFLQKPEPTSITFTIPDSSWTIKIDSLQDKIVKIEKDFQKLYPIVWRLSTEKETLIIDSLTPYKDVPVVTTEANDMFLIGAGDKIFKVPFTWTATHKGELFSMKFHTIPHYYSLPTTTEKPPFFKLYGSVGVLFDQDKKLYGNVESGCLILRRFSIFSQVEADKDLNTKIKVGCKIIGGL